MGPLTHAPLRGPRVDIETPTTARVGTQAPPGVYPDGNRSIWLLGMLATFRALGEETGGAYSVYEQSALRAVVAPARRTSGSHPAGWQGRTRRAGVGHSCKF